MTARRPNTWILGLHQLIALTVILFRIQIVPAIQPLLCDIKWARTRIELD